MLHLLLHLLVLLLLLLGRAEMMRSHRPPIILSALLPKQVLQGYLTAHGYTRLHFLHRSHLCLCRRCRNVHSILALGFELLERLVQALLRVGGAVHDQLRVDGARLGRGVWRRLRLDPDAVNAVLHVFLRAVWLVASTVLRGWVPGVPHNHVLIR